MAVLLPVDGSIKVINQRSLSYMPKAARIDTATPKPDPCKNSNISFFGTTFKVRV